MILIDFTMCLGGGKMILDCLCDLEWEEEMSDDDIGVIWGV